MDAPVKMLTKEEKENVLLVLTKRTTVCYTYAEYKPVKNKAADAWRYFVYSFRPISS
jgi:hypothetical protein